MIKRGNMKNKSIIVLSLLFLICSLFSNTNFRVMSYNTLNFDGTDRLTDFETVLTTSAPDILICQEIKTEAASDAILTILNSAFGGFVRANFVYDGDINNMLYYKTSIGTLVSQDVIDTSPRDISEYVMSIDGNTIRFYSCHLKASDGSSYEAERLAAVTILRNHLNALSEGTEFIIVGDMNFYTSSEDGYQKFIASETNNIGRAEDLCSEVGSWHNSVTYASVHSQSTRLESFGYGATGGLDDKFDFIFGNYGINNGSGIEYSSNSFTPYGNDGNHFDQSINNGTNSAVSADVADALYYASDHLPVYADFVSSSGGSATESNLIISQYYEGASYNKWIELSNTHATEEIDLTNPQLYLVLYSNTSADNPTNSNSTSTHPLTGSVTALNSILFKHPDAELPSYATGTDATACNFNGDDLVIVTTSDTTPWDSRIDIVGNGDSWGEDTSFCRKSSINTGSQTFSTSNWDEYTNTEVNDAIIGNTERLSEHLIDTPLPVNLSAFYTLYIGGTPTLYWTTQSEESNDYWNVYRSSSDNFTEAALLNEADPVPGNGTTNSPSDYIYVDTAPILQNTTYWYWIEDVSTDGETEVHEPITLTIPYEDAPITPDFYGLQQNYPNPFNPSTSISFTLEEESDVQLIIYNVKGEKIKTVFQGHIYADEISSAVWAGDDANGKQVSSGVYFYKLITDTKEYSKKMLLVK